MVDQGRGVEARKTNANHDRYIVIDEEDVWHVGPSFNNIGAKKGMISQIVDKVEAANVVAALRES